MFGTTGPEAFTCTEEWPAVAIEDIFGVDLADPVDLRVGSRLGTAEVLQTWIRFCRFGAVVLNFCVYMHTRGDFSPLPFARLWTASKCTKRRRKKGDRPSKESRRRYLLRTRSVAVSACLVLRADNSPARATAAAKRGISSRRRCSPSGLAKGRLGISSALLILGDSP